jgi:hypothetical protein
MTTTIEVNNETLETVKKARDLIFEKIKVQLRMPDIMSHIIVESPEDIAKKVIGDINDLSKIKEE